MIHRGHSPLTTRHPPLVIRHSSFATRHSPLAPRPFWRFPVPHSIVTETCEGVADCVDACPVACIHPSSSKNLKGMDWYWIDFSTCIDCGICLQVCPVEGAIVPEERPDLQKTPE